VINVSNDTKVPIVQCARKYLMNRELKFSMSFLSIYR